MIAKSLVAIWWAAKLASPRSDEAVSFRSPHSNKWERGVVLAELARPNVRGWYRNPSRAGVDSLGIAYRDDDTGNWRSKHPDFVFFHEVGAKIVASVVDQHGHHLDGALMKRKSLARFAGTHGDAPHRGVG